MNRSQKFPRPAHLLLFAAAFAFSMLLALPAAGNCVLTCAVKSAPLSAKNTEPVEFEVETESTGCSGDTSYLWDFGDGTSDMSQRPRHLFVAAGTYRWSVTVSRDAATCERSGMIIVSEERCVLTCTVRSVQATANTGDPIEFEVESESTGCIEPAGYSWDFGDGTAASSKTARHVYSEPGTYRWVVTVTQGSVTCKREGLIAVSRACPKPGKPEIQPDKDTVKGGQPYTVGWKPSEDLQSGGTYVVEVSRLAAFSQVEQTLTTPETAIVISIPDTSSEYRLYTRVRGVQPCGTESENSAPQELRVQPSVTPSPGTSFIFTRPGPAWVAEKDSSPPSGSVKVRNVGPKTDQISFIASGGFFEVEPNVLLLETGEEKEVNLRVRATAMGTPGFFAGSLEGLSGSSRIATPVTLQVVTAASGPDDVRVTASAGRVVFSAPRGQNPAPQVIVLSTGPLPPGTTVYLAPSVGPGGMWLPLDPSAFAAPVPPSGDVVLTLSVDRSLRTAEDGLPPLRTILRVGIVGARGSSSFAVLEVVDIETPVPEPGAGGLRPEGTDSLILPVVIRGSGLHGSTFVSDAWIRNTGTASAPVEMYWTPLGADGRKDQRVLRTSGIVIPAGQTLQLSDIVQAAFGLSEGTGLVEIRSESLSSLLVRSSVQSTTGPDASLRFGGGVDPVLGGEGIGAEEGKLRLPWVQAMLQKRYNVQISETAGAEASGWVAVFDSSGKRAGQPVPFSVLPRSVVALPGIVDRAEPGRILENGYAEVRLLQGSGKVVATGQLIDNTTNSFASFSARVIPASTPAKRHRTSIRAAEDDLFVPAVVKSPGQGTLFSTRLSIENTSELVSGKVTLTYHYIDGSTGKPAEIETSLGEIAPRAIKTYEDVIGEAFGFTHETPTYGWMRLRTVPSNGESEAPLMGAEALIVALVDPTDPSKGEKQTRVAGVTASSPDWTNKNNPDGERQLAGLEESPSRRTNFHAIEVSGKECRIQVRAIDKNANQVGQIREYTISPFQYFQLNQIFTATDPGLEVGDAPWENLALSVKVLGGDGQILTFASLNDNVSKQPEVLLLKAPKRRGPR